MVTLGLLQYLAPILQFALGVLYFHEDMPAGRWVGFVLVWVALVIFTYEANAHHAAASSRLNASPPPPPDADPGLCVASNTLTRWGCVARLALTRDLRSSSKVPGRRISGDTMSRVSV